MGWRARVHVQNIALDAESHSLQSHVFEVTGGHFLRLSQAALQLVDALGCAGKSARHNKLQHFEENFIFYLVLFSITAPAL